MGNCRGRKLSLGKLSGGKLSSGNSSSGNLSSGKLSFRKFRVGNCRVGNVESETVVTPYFPCESFGNPFDYITSRQGCELNIRASFWHSLLNMKVN